MNTSSTLKYSFLLLLVTVFWGSGFVAVRIALDSGFSPGLITLLRMSVGCIVMLPIFFKSILKTSKAELKHGMIAGSILFLGFQLQTLGMELTIISNSAFLTTTNVIMVPFLSWFILKKRPHSKVFISIALGFIGVSILTRAFDSNFSFNTGDILTLLSAVCFAVQIAYTEFAVKNVNANSFTFIELGATAVFSILYLLLFNRQSFSGITQFSTGIISCLYLGITCTFFAFWAQTIAQKHMPSSKTALVLSMEAVFASIFSILLGYENLEYTLLIGGSIIMMSIIILEINAKKAPPRTLPYFE